MFNIILDIERSRSTFFDNRRLRNKSSDPAIIWSNTIYDNFLGIYTKIIDTSILLYQRYKDEVQKSLTNNQEIPDSLREIISKNFVTNLELITLLNSYVTFVQKILQPDQKEKLVDALVTIESNYNLLLSSYFDLDLLKNNPEVREHLKSVEKANSSFRMSRRISEMGFNTDDQRIQVSVNEAQYFLKNLPEFLRMVFSDFWYEDHLLLSFIQEDAIQRTTVMQELSENPEISFKSKRDVFEILENDIPELKAYQKYTESKFLIEVAKVRIKSLEIKEASIELKSAIHSLEQVFHIIGLYPKNDKIKRIYNDTVFLFEELTLINLLVNLNFRLSELLQAIQEEDMTSVQNCLNKVKDQLRTHDFNFDIQYLSALPTIYENIATNLELIFSNSMDFMKARKSIENNFENIERRIVIATNQVVTAIENLSMEDDDLTDLKLKPTLDTIEILQITNALLPDFTPSKNHNNNRFKILEHLGNSLLFEMKAFKKAKDSPLKEMIFKTKAYHHANLAYFEFNNLGTKDVPINRIKAHYSGSFVSANKLQIDLYKSIIQYICINQIIPDIYQMVNFELTKEDTNVYEYWQQRVNSFNEFSEILQHIIKSSQIIFEHYQIHGTVVSGINWEGIKQIENLSKGINQYLEALKEVVLGNVANRQKRKEDAIIHFTDAKNLSFKASENLQMINLANIDLSDAATYIFNFARFCQEAASNPSRHEIQEFPMTEAVKLLRDLVFSI